MLALDQAIKTRWNALSLTSGIPGGIWDSQIPEATWTANNQPMYCSFENVTDSKFRQTQSSRYQRMQVKFTVWGTDKVSVATACETIQDSFNNSNRANTSQLAVPQPDGIVSFMLTTPYTMAQISDTVWSGSQIFTATVRRQPELNPA